MTTPRPAILAKLRAVRRCGAGWVARCPAHEDARPSLSVGVGEDGRTLLNCHAGCAPDAIVAKVDMTLQDLMPPPAAAPGQPRRREVCAYDYRDERDRLLYQVVRFAPKDFRCRRPDGAGGWVWNLKGVRLVPYRLPELAEQPRAYVVEGEKDADALAALGLAATCNHGGAGKWREEHTAALVAAAVPEVVVIPDNDQAGQAHAQQIARACVAAGLRVKVLPLAGLPDKGDVSDWLDAGHDAAELEALAEAVPRVADAAETAQTGWPSPTPVPHDLAPVPAFDVAQMMPAPFAPWVADIADRSQCPADFLGIATLVGVGTVVGRSITIRPKRQDDWTVVPNLWGVAIGRPGIMKTPPLHEATRPLDRLVAEARTAHAARMAEYTFVLAQAKLRREVLQKKLKKALEKGTAIDQATDALREALTAPLPTAPTERRYLVNDATVEKLGAILNENPNGVELFRDELVGWTRLMDRDGHENDRAFFCEAWNGTGAYTYDRIGRGTLHIPAVCVSILGGMTPGPLHAYLRAAFAHGASDDGLIQRFQLMVYPDVGPEWHNVDRWPNTEAKRRAFEIFAALATLEPETIQAHQPDHAGGLPFLRFTPEAQACFDAWRATLERRLRTPDEHPVVVSHLAKYRSLMPSLALLFHLIECVDLGRGGPVSLAAAARAALWCAYLEAHARRVYESVTASRRLAAAAIAAKLGEGKLANPFRARDVLQAEWAGLTDADEVRAGLALLETLHWIRRVDVPASVKGGRSTVDYYVNPAIAPVGTS